MSQYHTTTGMHPIVQGKFCCGSDNSLCSRDKNILSTHTTRFIERPGFYSIGIYKSPVSQEWMGLHKVAGLKTNSSQRVSGRLGARFTRTYLLFACRVALPQMKIATPSRLGTERLKLCCLIIGPTGFLQVVFQSGLGHLA